MAFGPNTEHVPTVNGNQTLTMSNLIPNGIMRLMTCVIDMARDELKQLDPTFVQRVDDMLSLNSLGLVYPETDGSDLPTPTHRLSNSRHRVLESMMDFYASID